jgi:hypothetical protein
MVTILANEKEQKLSSIKLTAVEGFIRCFNGHNLMAYPRRDHRCFHGRLCSKPPSRLLAQTLSRPTPRPSPCPPSRPPHYRRHLTNALQRQFRICIPFLGIARPHPQFPHSCVCEQFIYYQDRSTYLAAAK